MILLIDGIKKQDLNMKNFKLITLGSDPEFFIKRGKNYFPPFIFTNGSKDKPEEIKRHKGYSILIDNLTLEGNIPPAYNKQEFINNMKILLEIMNTRLALKKGFSIAHESAVKFQPRFLQSPKSREIGCAPDFNAFVQTDSVLRTISLLKHMNNPYRAAGFHIHIGYDTSGFNIRGKALLDILITQLFELFVVNSFEEDIKGDRVNAFRKEMYGVGEFFGYYRQKSYGLECRGLGSYFTRPEYIELVWDKVELIFEYLNTANDLDSLLFKQKNIESIVALKEYFKENNKYFDKIETLNKKIHV